MKKSSNIRFASLAAVLFVASVAAGAFLMSAATPAHVSENHAAWISSANTVGEQALEADLIVRVQALDRGDTRRLWHPVPAGGKRAGSFVFTDTLVEVLEVYRGDVQVGDVLPIMQTGGEIAVGGERSRVQLAEDPLYDLDSEMVLFLLDISGDSVHAAGSDLYRTINPAGRYDVQGTLVSSSADFGPTARRPGTLESLESEIREAVDARARLEAFD